MSQNKKRILVLALVTLFAGLLRFWQLDKFPVSLNWDEVSHGYNAYSILKTGMDEWGKHFPLIFRAFGDYKLPVYIYLTVIPVAIFGLNAFAVRFVSALAGTLAIPGIYLLINILFPDKDIKLGKIKLSPGLIGAFLLAVDPWHFFISRPALEANLSLTFIIFGFYFFIKGFSKNINFMWSAILLGLSLHTYNTSRVFVPLLLLAGLLIYRKKIKFTRINILSALVLGAFAAIVAVQLLTGEATARYSKLAILSDNAVFQIGQQRDASKLPGILPKLIYNRPVYFIKTAATNYLEYFSPQFIYQNRGAQTQFAIPIKNLFTLPATILALVGIIFVLINIKSTNNIFILSWLLISPVAAAITADPPQALRPNPMIPVVILLAVAGLYFILARPKTFLKTFTFVVILLSCTLSFYFYLTNYYGDYADNYSSSWQYGYQDVIDYVNREGSKYDHIFITKNYGEPHIFYAFYSKLDPKMLQPGGDNIRYEKSGWYWTDKIGKVYFINEWDIPNLRTANTFKLESGGEISTKNSLLITTMLRIPSNTEILKTVKFKEGYFAFIIAKIP